MDDLYSAEGVERSTGIDFFSAPLAQLFDDVLDRIRVGDFFAVEDGDTTTYSLTLSVRDDLFVQVPGLDAIGLGIVVDSEDESPLIYCELVTGGDEQSLSVRHFPLRIAIANPLFEPAAIEGRSETVEGFSFEIEGGFTLTTAPSFSATMDSFSLPPFRIVGTGLTLALDQCRLIVDADDVDDHITALGFDSAFRGVHATSALVDWDIPWQRNGAPLPGLHAEISDVALGNGGVSATAELTWAVNHDAGQFDPNGTELLGVLFDPTWTCALEQLRLVVRANVPSALGVRGYLRVPFLAAIFRMELYQAYAGEGDYELRAALGLAAGEQVDFDLGHPDYRLQIGDLAISGRLDHEGFQLHGETGIDLVLPGLTLAADRAELDFTRSADGETFVFGLEQVTIDTLGTLDAARLEIATVRDHNGDTVLDRLVLGAELAWSGLSPRIALAPLPDAFPLPPDDAEVTLAVTWEEATLSLSVEAGLEDVDGLWRFIPETHRPTVQSATLRIALNASGQDFDGEASLRLRLRLPDPAAIAALSAAGLGELVTIETGDSEGWIDAEFTAVIDSDGNSSSGGLSASLAAPVALSFQLPGLSLPQPPLALQIDTIDVRLDVDDDASEGELALGGRFALRPILPDELGGFVPPMMALQLERLLAVAHLYDLVGEATLRIGVADQGGFVAFDGTFEDAGLELDLFDMLAGATAHLGSGGPVDNPIDLDIEVSFALRRLNLSVGHVPDTDTAGATGIPFRFGIVAELGFAGQYADLEFELSREALRFGFADLAIPLFIPQLPIRRDDLDRLRGTDGAWDPTIWLQQIEPEIDRRLADAEAELEAARQLLEDGGIDDEQLLFELQYRTILAAQKEILHDTGHKFLHEAILAVHQLLGQLSGTPAQTTYQGLVEVYQDAVDLTLGWVKFDTGLQFVISRAEFVLPFNDPSAIAVEGSASLQGFAPESPLRPLADLEFTLGLSADAIYFAVEGGADPIPLPDLGRYPGNGVVVDRLAIGYGYSKNSLNVDFAGELLLSSRLIADLDTSQQIGAGVRLPGNNRLRFKLDLIPITLGEVEFLLPLIAFDIDLRSDHPPSPSTALPCAPTWDGLQLQVPGLLHADLKRANFSPFFGPLPAPNTLYSYDFDIGNDQLGMTFVCADYQTITPVLGTIPIPFLADTTPFFDRLCCDLRLAGFGIHFELRRPFPHPSPLMIFELLGFLSDPTLPIDPAGHLADLMWAELNNGRIRLPPAVHAMFPERGTVVDRELAARINVGTVITIVQGLAGVVGELGERLAAVGDDIGEAVEALLEAPPELEVNGLLDALPGELRRVALNGAFVGFDASAVFLMTTPADLLRRLPPAPPPDDGLHWQNLVLDRFTRNPLRGWRQVDHGLKRGDGEWAIEHGALVQRNNVGDNSAGRYGAMLIRETGPLSDIRITVEMHSTDNDGMGIVFLVQGDTTFYRFRMTAEQREWRLIRLRRGRTRLLQVTQTAFLPNQNYRVRIETRSVTQASAGLRPAHPAAVPELSPGSVRLGRNALSEASTRIRIWVNEALWCDLIDDDRPLTEGEVGLDSWWNQGARFDNFQIDRAQRGPVGLAGAASLAMTRDLLPLTGRVAQIAMPSGPSPAWAADDLDAFDAGDLQVALGGVTDAAVVVTARVRVMGDQVFRFVGVVHADGRFRLSSTAAIEPLRLRVGGLTLPATLQVDGRLRLEGQAAGATSWARVIASLYGEWQLLPSADGALAALTVGRPGQPAGLVIDSDGGFAVTGDGQLRLFNDAIVVDAALDIGNDHAAFRGRVDFSPDLFVSGQQRLLALSVDVAGRVGPGRHLLLTGGGDLELFGRACSDVAARLTEEGIGLRARIDVDGEVWRIKGFDLEDAELALRGEARFATSVPALRLEGDGRFAVNGLHVDGSCRITADADDWCIGVAGRLNWQGRDWLQGRLELCRDGLTAGGRTDFALDLTPAQLPAGIQLAGLYLTATIDGNFSVRASGRLRACAFDVAWTLSIRLPGGHSQQTIPIARQRLRVEREGISSRASVTLADLIEIDGWSLLPLQGLTVPLPVLSDSDQALYLHEGIHVDPPSFDFPITLLTASPPDSNAQPDYDLGLVSLYRYRPVIQPPDFDVPLPVVSDTPPTDGADPLFTLPQIRIEDVTIEGDVRLDRLKLGLKLVWKDGQLGIRVTQTGAFHAFDSLPSLTLLLTGTLLSPLG